MQSELPRFLQTDYLPSKEEAEEVHRYVRRETGRYAKIDPERISLEIREYKAFSGSHYGDGYWRPNLAEMTVDGKAPDPKQRWWCQQVMIGTRRKIDPSRRRPELQDAEHAD